MIARGAPFTGRSVTEPGLQAGSLLYALARGTYGVRSKRRTPYIGRREQIARSDSARRPRRVEAQDEPSHRAVRESFAGSAAGLAGDQPVAFAAAGTGEL